MKTVFRKNLNEETMLPEELFPAIHQQRMFQMIQINEFICTFDT